MFSWVKVFRSIPEFRVLRLTLVSLKMLNSADFNSFFDLFTVHLWAIDHLNFVFSLVKVFRIIPEFRNRQKVSLKILN